MRDAHHHRRAPPVDRLLDALLGAFGNREPTAEPPRSGPPGPLRSHRFGHDDGVGADSTSGDGAVADVLAAVEREAGRVHERLAHDNDVFAVELLGATGSGKTALVERLLARRRDEDVAVIAGDVAGDDDARRLRERGVPAVDVTTGKDCHLDPGRVDDALDELDLARLDTLFVENVGNMVCPADFPLGAHCRVVVVSTTEGADVVRKHPLVFQACDLAVVNKVDIADAVGTDVEEMVADVDRVAPGLPVVTTSAETGRGVANLDGVLRERRTEDDHHRHHDHAHGH